MRSRVSKSRSLALEQRGCSETFRSGNALARGLASAKPLRPEVPCSPVHDQARSFHEFAPKVRPKTMDAKGKGTTAVPLLSKASATCGLRASPLECRLRCLQTFPSLIRRPRLLSTSTTSISPTPVPAKSTTGGMGRNGSWNPSRLYGMSCRIERIRQRRLPIMIIREAPRAPRRRRRRDSRGA